MFISPLPGRILQACTAPSPPVHASNIYSLSWCLIFCSVCHICTFRQLTVLPTLLTWAQRRTTHCISSPGWAISTLSWVGQKHTHTHTHDDIQGFGFFYINKWSSSSCYLPGGSLVSMWKSAMCSVTTREEGRQMLGQLLLNPGFATSSFISIITKMTTSCWVNRNWSL